MLVCIEALRGHRITLAAYGHESMADFSHPNIQCLRTVKFMGFAGLAVVASLVVGFFQWMWILATERPDVIFSTGAEVAIAPIVIGKLFRRRTIFLETAARMEQPSGTGKVVYPFCDCFFVQSEAMLKHYGPKARFVGSLL